MTFQKAQSGKRYLRMAIAGISKTGKTLTALKIAKEFGKKVAVVDSEYGTSTLYANEYDFDVLMLDDYDPLKYVEAIQDAERSGYDVLIIDSISHEWAGKNGVLEQVDRTENKAGGKFASGWKDLTPRHNRFIDALLAARLHLIVTMRMKTDYAMTDGGKVVKLGLGVVQRDNVEYEFDILAQMDLSNTMHITGTRCPEIRGASYPEPAGPEVAQPIKDWLAGKVVAVDRRIIADFEVLKKNVPKEKWDEVMRQFSIEGPEGFVNRQQALQAFQLLSAAQGKK